jgi:hypothetical protein
MSTYYFYNKKTQNNRRKNRTLKSLPLEKRDKGIQQDS